jgi:hypothetical protein
MPCDTSVPCQARAARATCSAHVTKRFTTRSNFVPRLDKQPLRKGKAMIVAHAHAADG